MQCDVNRTLTGRASALHLVTMEACRLCVVESAAIKARVKTDPALQAEFAGIEVQYKIRHLIGRDVDVDTCTACIAVGGICVHMHAQSAIQRTP